MNLRRLLAPNPGPYTGPGTNTWVVASSGAAVVIDPGPRIPGHERAILEAVDGLEVSAVLVTHTHPDHAPAANPLATSLGVPALGAAPGPEFDPDRRLGDGDLLRFGTAEVVCLATPGHTPDSLSYRIGDVLFSGDHIMGGSTVVIEDLAAYMASLRRLLGIGLERICPGHGPVIDDPDALIAGYIAHREDRERQILGAIDGGAATLGDVVLHVYREVDPSLHPAAAVSVAAHLTKLSAEGVVTCDPEPRWDSPVGRS